MKTENNFVNVSHYVPVTLPFSNSFYNNLTDIFKLKETLINEGIIVPIVGEKGYSLVPVGN